MYASTARRSSSGVRGTLGFALRPVDLGLDLLRDLGQLLQDFDRRLGVLRRFEPLARRLEALVQLLGAGERLLAHAASRSLAIRPRMPLTRRPASSEA